MTKDAVRVTLDPASGGVVLHADDQTAAPLHPLWLRERSRDPAEFDAGSFQRTFDACTLPGGQQVVEAQLPPGGPLALVFADGARVTLPIDAVEAELGWKRPTGEPPAAEPWGGDLTDRPEATWASLDDPTIMRAMVGGFFRRGFCLIHDAPSTPGSLEAIAGRFGYLRETNFGKLFDVKAKPNPIDLAYTGLALAAHSDNPYRRPVPGIQFLHCLESTVAGGLSTLVDGAAIVGALEEEMPAETRLLETIPVRFVYKSGLCEHQEDAPLVTRKADGTLKQLRFSPRLDYVPPMAPTVLENFYRARRRLHQLAHDPAFQIEFRIPPGAFLMMDNHRLLHGRTAYESDGARWLQGCYIDHDGPESLYRLLARGSKAVEVGREVA